MWKRTHSFFSFCSNLFGNVMLKLKCKKWNDKILILLRTHWLIFIFCFWALKRSNLVRLLLLCFLVHCTQVSSILSLWFTMPNFIRQTLTKQINADSRVFVNTFLFIIFFLYYTLWSQMLALEAGYRWLTWAAGLFGDRQWDFTQRQNVDIRAATRGWRCQGGHVGLVFISLCILKLLHQQRTQRAKSWGQTQGTCGRGERGTTVWWICKAGWLYN